MAYSLELADRVRALLSGRDDVAERPMRGFVIIASDGMEGATLKGWVDLAVAHAEAQPPRQPRRKTVGT